MARRPPRHAARSKAPFPVLLGLILVAGAVALWRAWGPNDGVRADAGSPSAQLPSSASPSPAGSGPTGAPSPAGDQIPGPINTAFPGITTFRGNATRDYYGEGPVPRHPVIRWSYPRERRALFDVGGRGRFARLVRNRVDRPAERDRARGRPDRDP